MKYKNEEILLKNIHPNIKNPRKGTYDKSDMEELKESMQSMGQITPIIIDEGGHILGGHRRYQAAKELGWTSLKTQVMKDISVFKKSAILISDNATQKRFNAWDMRKSIYDMYWNEFCEEYKFKNDNDKGYPQFSAMLGIGRATITKILESMKRENIMMGKKLKTAGCGVEAFDCIITSPKRYRDKMFKRALKLQKSVRPSFAKEFGMREHLRAYKKQLNVTEFEQEKLHPKYFATTMYKIDAIGQIFSPQVIKSANINDLIKVNHSIKKNILVGYRLIEKEIKNRK